MGKRLIQYGIENYAVEQLTVNGQNPQARGFYKHMGFRIYKRTALDEQGTPYPLLYMRLMHKKRFYEERYAAKYAQAQAYALCPKEDNYPIDYIQVDMEEYHDFGYGLRKEFWHKGIMTEAGKAVIEQLKKDVLPYITATHDRNNPRSGGVMRNVGTKY